MGITIYINTYLIRRHKEKVVYFYFINSSYINQKKNKTKENIKMKLVFLLPLSLLNLTSSKQLPESMILDFPDYGDSKLPPCQQQKKVGRCRAAFPRYYYNHISKTCESFIYGGCDKNANNFKTMEDCTKACDGFTPEPSTEIEVESNAAVHQDVVLNAAKSMRSGAVEVKNDTDSSTGQIVDWTSLDSQNAQDASDEYYENYYNDGEEKNYDSNQSDDVDPK